MSEAFSGKTDQFQSIYDVRRYQNVYSSFYLENGAICRADQAQNSFISSPEPNTHR